MTTSHGAYLHLTIRHYNVFIVIFVPLRYTCQKANFGGKRVNYQYLKDNPQSLCLL